jgi:diguanylate cyclase (GGDEF)-like protein
MRILLADDNVASSRALASLLRQWGYEPVVSHDGLEALRLLQGPEAPRLALLDWMMPGMDGVQVCRTIRRAAEGGYTYVILVTGAGTRHEMIDGLEAGADDFLLKPMDGAELKARLHAGRRLLDLQEQLLATQRLLQERATRDALTGLWNRALILDILERELARSRREGGPVGVIMADIDHFKAVNDRHGHLAGDEVLRQVGRRMRAVLRPYDTIGRYGGEEFLAVLPGCGCTATMALAERLRQCVAAEAVDADGEPIRVTLSLGVAAGFGSLVGDSAELLRAADGALYQVKRGGRNRVELGTHAGRELATSGAP